MEVVYNSRYVHWNTSTKHKLTSIAFKGDVKALAFQKANLHRVTFVIPYRITAPSLNKRLFVQPNLTCALAVTFLRTSKGKYRL